MENFNYDNKRIAIIDDEEVILNSYSKMLGHKGFWTITFNNPIEALEWFKNNDVDVILLDYYMPEKTGGEFAEEYKGNAVIILQTGYSDELPSDEMLDKFNIQGYFDKTKDIEELVLAVKSAVKTAELYKKVNILDYEKEFIGNLLVRVTDEMKEQLMVMSVPKMLLNDKAEELNSEELKEIAQKWQYSVNIIERTLGALNFRTSYIATVNDIFDVVKILTLAKSCCKFIETQETISINCQQKYLVYLLSEIVMYLYENDVSDVEVSAKKIDNNVTILLNKPCNYSEDIIRKLNNIATFDNNIKINLLDNMIEIIIG